MSTDSNTDALPAGFVLTGGIPTKAQDLAAYVSKIVNFGLNADAVRVQLR